MPSEPAAISPIQMGQPGLSDIARSAGRLLPITPTGSKGKHATLAAAPPLTPYGLWSLHHPLPSLHSGRPLKGIKARFEGRCSNLEVSWIAGRLPVRSSEPRYFQ